jgi:hypothetical protein
VLLLWLRSTVQQHSGRAGGDPDHLSFTPDLSSASSIPHKYTSLCLVGLACVRFETFILPTVARQQQQCISLQSSLPRKLDGILLGNWFKF